MNIVHTSKTEAGQIYIPEVNTALMIGCLFVVLGFRSSSALGAAYGIAVTGTMAITTILYYRACEIAVELERARAPDHLRVFSDHRSRILQLERSQDLHGGWVPIVIGS